MNELALRVVARFQNRADLEPPLGYPGGPCQVVERIEQEIKNPKMQEKLVENVERGTKVENQDASKIYTQDRENGVGVVDKITISPHAQYRMDLRSITVPAVRAAIKSLMKLLGDWKAQKSPRYDDIIRDWAKGEPYNWTDPKMGLTVVVRPNGPKSLLLVTTYWRGGSDPRAPGGCP
jgi:hypothetical protein